MDQEICPLWKDDISWGGWAEPRVRGALALEGRLGRRTLEGVKAGRPHRVSLPCLVGAAFASGFEPHPGLLHAGIPSLEERGELPGGLRECTLTTGLENYSGRLLCGEVEEIIPSADLVDFFFFLLLIFFFTYSLWFCIVHRASCGGV